MGVHLAAAVGVRVKMAGSLLSSALTRPLGRMKRESNDVVYRTLTGSG